MLELWSLAFDEWMKKIFAKMSQTHGCSKFAWVLNFNSINRVSEQSKCIRTSRKSYHIDQWASFPCNHNQSIKWRVRCWFWKHVREALIVNTFNSLKIIATAKQLRGRTSERSCTPSCKHRNHTTPSASRESADHVLVLLIAQTGPHSPLSSLHVHSNRRDISLEDQSTYIMHEFYLDGALVVKPKPISSRVAICVTHATSRSSL